MNRFVADSTGAIGLGGVLEPKEKFHINADNDSIQIDNLTGSGSFLGIDTQGKVYRANLNIKSSVLVTSNYTIDTNNDVVLADANSNTITILFPSAPVDGQTHTVKRINGSGNQVILNGNGNNWYLINQ